jgi:hypothetical protein
MGDNKRVMGVRLVSRVVSLRRAAAGAVARRRPAPWRPGLAFSRDEGNWDIRCVGCRVFGMSRRAPHHLD